MESNTTALLTSTEIAALWTQYMNDTMSICFSKYALETIEDPEIKEIYEEALSLSEKHVLYLQRPNSPYNYHENYQLQMKF